MAWWCPARRCTQIYRDCLRKQVHGNVHFILLDGSRELISDRMKKRKGHFMPPALLDSQFATLEATAEEHATILDISHPAPALLAEAARSLVPRALIFQRWHDAKDACGFAGSGCAPPPWRKLLLILARPNFPPRRRR